MGLIFRTSSAANTVPSSIKNAPLTYQEGDGNFAYLLTNMSGSVITLEGGVDVTGSLEVVGPVTTFNGVGFWDPTTLQFNTITANNGNLILTGSLYGTASWALSASNAASAAYAPTPTLQQVTTTGNLTTNDIYIQGEGIFFGNQGINLYAGTSGFPGGTRAAVNIYEDLLGDSQTLTTLGTEYSSSGYTLSIARPILGSSYSLTYPTTGGFFAVSVNSTASNAAGNITITTVPTASFVTASNVYGPHGSSSVLSSSFAISASWAPSTSTNTGSLLTTASVSNNTITFTKGDGSTFPITVNTGSGGGVSGGTQYYVPVWTGASTLGTSSLYESGSILTIISGSNQTGLRLDFKNNTYAIGNNLFSGATTRLYLDSQFGNFWVEHLGNRVIQSYLNTKRIVLGDIDNTTNYTLFDVDSGNSTIKTSYGGNDIGLKLDFASGDYILGAGVNNSTNIGIYGNSSLRTQGPGGGNEGIQLSTQLYEFGDYDNLNNQTKLTIDDTTQTIALTGSLQVTGSTYLRGLTSSSQTNVLTYNSSTGQVFFTASSAIGGGGSPIDTSTFLTTGSLSTTQQLSGSLNITGSLNFFSGSQQQLQIQNGILILSQVSASLDFANDAAAAAGGVPLGGLYRNGNAISIRIV